jgi:unsaturated rhamnogalacturonyl hydrolase
MKSCSALLLPVLLAAAPLGLAATGTESPFADWPTGAAPEEIGRRIAERFLVSPHALWPQFGTMSYSEVVTWYGALTYAELANNRDLATRLAVRFDPLFAGESNLVPPVNHVDNSVFGALPLELYRQTGQTRYRVLGLAFADGQWDRPTPEGLTNQTRFWIDDMYMITALQVQAYRATGATAYLDHAASEMVVYLERLQRPNGLFYHAPDAPFFWGRGNGWMAAGMTELLRALPETHPLRPRILAGYRQMMAQLLALQASDGMWHQLLDHPEAWPETSCTGMFTFAFVTGVKNDWLDAATYGPAARRAWLALITYLEPNGDLREVCVGTGTKNDLQHYLTRPRSVGDFHGQAPLLWTASAFLRP